MYVNLAPIMKISAICNSITIQLQSPVNAAVSNLDDQLQGMSLIYIQDNKWSNTRQQCLDEIVSPKPSFY